MCTRGNSADSARSINLSVNQHSPFYGRCKHLYAKITVMAECTPEEELIETPEVLAKLEADQVTFKIVWKKNTYDLTFPRDLKAIRLKQHIHELTGIPPAMMKLVYKGLVKDDKTLRELNVLPGSKMMVVGSTLGDVITVQAPSPDELKAEPQVEAPPKELFCEMKEHKKIIEKGVPEDVPPGLKGKREPLPAQPLSGMLNKFGAKVRLHFKLEMDQLWIGTKERTEKIPLSSIKKIVSEPIKGHEEYHIVALQVGPTELSRYWIYWVPAQYVEAIKDTILGKWQFF